MRRWHCYHIWRRLHGETSGTATVLANGLTSPDGKATIANDGAHLLRFGVRHIIPAESVQGIGWIARLAQTHPAEEDAAVGLVLLLPGYFVELGFYGLVLLAALWARRRHRLDEAEASRTALVLAVAGLAVSTFLRSTIVENNDFAMRSVLIAQFFLLLLAVVWWEGGFASTNRFLRGAMLAMAWIGLAGTVYQAVALRVYLPVEERLGRAEVDGLAERAMAVRLGFDAMRRSVANNAVVQYNTAQPGEYFVSGGGDAGGPSDGQCNAGLRRCVRRRCRRVPGRGAGRGAAVCGGLLARLFAGIAGAFSPGSFIRPKTPGSSGGALSASQARDQCVRLGVDDLIASRWDAVWSDPRGWVWTLPAVADTGEVRVLACAAPVR